MATWHHHSCYFSCCSLHSSHNDLLKHTKPLRTRGFSGWLTPCFFSSLWYITLLKKCSLAVHSTNNGTAAFLHHSSPLFLFSLLFIMHHLIYTNACRIMHGMYILVMGDYEESNKVNTTVLYFPSEHWLLPDVVL